MKMNDSIVVETLERKNDLESYIYSMRRDLESAYAEFVQADTLPAFFA